MAEASTSGGDVPAEPLTELLQRACPGGPASIRGADPGAALALALHVQMVDAGLQVLLPDGTMQQPKLRYQPAAGWHGSFPDEWVFEYAARGKAHKLVLHCSLQRKSGRMFVNATEPGNLTNSQVLGLQLENYVPSVAAMSSKSWAGVVARQPALRAMFQEHVLQPLVEGAQELPTSASGLSDWRPPTPTGWAAYLPDRRTLVTTVLPAVAVTAIAAAALTAYALQRSSRQRQGGRW